jgi:hypothetical protein
MIRFGLAMSTAGCLLFSAERFGVLLTPVAWHTSFANPYSMAFVLCAAGAWALSAREKQTIETAWGTRRRLAMRWLFTVALAVHFFDWLLLRIDYWFPPAAYYAVANDIIRVSRPLGIGLQLYLVAELARRAPHRQLARWARVIGYWVAGAIGISGVVAITMPALPAGVSNPQYVATRHYCILIVAWGDAAAWLVSALVLAVMFKSIRERCAPVLDPRVDGDPSPANDPPVA